MILSVSIVLYMGMVISFPFSFLFCRILLHKLNFSSDFPTPALLDLISLDPDLEWNQIWMVIREKKPYRWWMTLMDYIHGNFGQKSLSESPKSVCRHFANLYLATTIYFLVVWIWDLVAERVYLLVTGVREIYGSGYLDKKWIGPGYKI